MKIWIQHVFQLAPIKFQRLRFVLNDMIKLFNLHLNDIEFFKPPMKLHPDVELSFIGIVNASLIE